MSAAGELAISVAKDFMPARPSARFGSCCMNDSPKLRSTAVTSFFRKISIIAWRALAPKVSEVVTCFLLYQAHESDGLHGTYCLKEWAGTYALMFRFAPV